MIYRILIGILMLSQSSCIGLNFVVGTKQMKVSDSIGPTVGKRGYEAGNTKEEVLRLWGQPKRIIVQGTREYWVYKSEETAWRGAEIFVIVPVPLLVPAGRKKVLLEFQNGYLISYTIGNARQHEFGFFVFDGGLVFNFESQGCEGGWGCY